MNPQSDCPPMKNQTKALYQAQRRANPVVRSLEQSSDNVRRRNAHTNQAVREQELEHLSMNTFVGGPQSTDTTNMTASEAKFAKESDKKRKQWTDIQRLKRLKQNTVGSPPRKWLTSSICWTNVPHQGNLLDENWRGGDPVGINVRVVQSDYTNLTVSGSSFHASGRSWYASTYPPPSG
jgi:hypothetical protein